MASVYQKNESYQALLSHLEGGEIGRLFVGEGPTEISVYVMYGGIVGAISTADDRQVVRRLKIAGVLTNAQARALGTILKAEKPILNVLLDMLSEETLQDFLYDRFIENIARFISANGTCGYEKLQAVFIDNLQMGHDPLRLFKLCEKAAESAEKVDFHLHLKWTNTPTNNVVNDHILEIFGTGNTLSKVIDDMPLESLAARARIYELMQHGHLVKAHAGDAPDEEPEIVGQRTVYTETPPAPRSPSRGFVNQRVTVPDSAPVKEDKPNEVVVVDTPPSPAVMEPLYNNESEEWEDPIVDAPTEEAEKQVSEPEDEPTEKSAFVLDDVPPVRTGPAEAQEQKTSDAGNLSSLKDWYDHEEEDVDVMEAFRDYDTTRGAGEGHFTSEQRHLDRVEVGVTEPDEEIIEAGDGSGELFSEKIANQKLQVTNEVLCAVAKAFTTQLGGQAGQASITDLLRSCPSNMQALFDSVTCDRNGAMSTGTLLANLQKRPMAEQRRVLHRGMMDIIERALSLAADELPDHLLDELMESTQGYRQRLGT